MYVIVSVCIKLRFSLNERIQQKYFCLFVAIAVDADAIMCKLCARFKEKRIRIFSVKPIERKCCYSSMWLLHIWNIHPHSASRCKHRPRVTFYVYMCTLCTTHRWKKKKKPFTAYINTHERSVWTEVSNPPHIIWLLLGLSALIFAVSTRCMYASVSVSVCMCDVHASLSL